MARNLLKNPSGKEKMMFWDVTKEEGDGWQVQKMPGACGHPFPQYFATSFGLCLKKQVIDLVSEGYSLEDLDTEPLVTVEDWYSGRHDCGCTYQLTVCLLDGNMKVLKKFEPKSVTLDPSDCYWRGVSYTFSEYGKGLRFISFENGGKDTSNWKGWYGVRVTDSAIKVHCSV